VNKKAKAHEPIFAQAPGDLKLRNFATGWEE
jgi:hypothetical protein